MKKTPMTASAFWDTLEQSADNGWISQELHNLLAYYLRVDLKLSDQGPLEIIKGYRKWFESPTNYGDPNLLAHQKRQAADKELWDLVMSFKTCEAFKQALKKTKK